MLASPYSQQTSEQFLVDQTGDVDQQADQLFYLMPRVHNSCIFNTSHFWTVDIERGEQAELLRTVLRRVI
jgi:hypothetical protein